MRISRMWRLAVNESFGRGGRSCRAGRSSPLGPAGYSSLSSPMTPRGWCIKALDLEALGNTDEPWGASICQAVMLFIGLTIFISTLIILRSVRADHAVCIVPRVSMWGSPRLQGMVYKAQSKVPEKQKFNGNDKAWLLKQAAENGTTSCGNMSTAQALVFGFELPSKGGNIRLQTNELYQILLISYTEDGIRRCSGGDFYETDLSGVHWKHRPPIKDLGDGSYLVSLKVAKQMAGIYTLKVVLLFSNLHGLDHWPDEWVQEKDVVHLQLEFIDRSPVLSENELGGKSDLKICKEKDFQQGAWHGRWTRPKANDSCTADPEGRFRCLDPTEPCDSQWCQGPLGSLESNGWVYSAHCTFRIFTPEEAWGCLKGRWLFFWGDSNHQDTIRNLLNFVLGRQDSGLWRTFESSFSNPKNSSQALKITSYFNGHYEESGNNLGLRSLNNSDYRQSVRSYFLPSDDIVPDTVILNSGLHDGKAWSNLTLFAQGASNASKFWGGVWKGASADESRRPRVVFRTTVAPAGQSRRMPANPHKMEVFNTILWEELVSTFGAEAIKVVDAYDMTFPWHYDNMYSDGGHYGRPPSLNSRQGITTGHQYFVDVMLAHVLLNAICPLH